MFIHSHVMQTFQSMLGWVMMLGQPQAVLRSPMEKEAATGVQRGV